LTEQSRQAGEEFGALAPEVPTVLPRFSAEAPAVLPRFASIESWISTLPEKPVRLFSHESVRSISTQTTPLMPTLAAVANPRPGLRELASVSEQIANSELVLVAPQVQRSRRAWQLLPSVGTWSALRRPSPIACPAAEACEEKSDAMELLKLFDSVLGTPSGGSIETTVTASITVEVEELPDLWRSEAPTVLDANTLPELQQQPCWRSVAFGGISDLPGPLAEETIQGSQNQQLQQLQQEQEQQCEQEQGLEDLQLQEQDQDQENEAEPERQPLPYTDVGEVARSDWPLSDSDPLTVPAHEGASSDAAAAETCEQPLAMAPDVLRDLSPPTPGAEHALQEELSHLPYEPVGHRRSFLRLPSVGTWLLHAQDGRELELDTPAKQSSMGAAILNTNVDAEKVDKANDMTDVKKLIDAISIAKLKEDGSAESATCTPSTINHCGSKHFSDCTSSPCLDAGAPLSFDPYAPSTLDDGKPVPDAESGECPVS